MLLRARGISAAQSAGHQGCLGTGRGRQSRAAHASHLVPIDADIRATLTVPRNTRSRRASSRRRADFPFGLACSESSSASVRPGSATKQQRRAAGLGSGQALRFTRLRGAGSLAAVRARAYV